MEAWGGGRGVPRVFFPLEFSMLPADKQPTEQNENGRPANQNISGWSTNPYRGQVGRSLVVVQQITAVDRLDVDWLLLNKSQPWTGWTLTGFC